MNKPNLTKIKAYLPFTFSEEIDPRAIFGVGDQVAAEHLIAFHGRRNLKTGFGDLMSAVSIDSARNTVGLNLKRPIVKSDGAELKFQEICETVSKSLEGTTHAPYAKILRGLKCFESSKQIELNFSKIPLNLLFLFTLPDFGIFDSSAMPIKNNAPSAATGPYYLETLEAERVKLRLNPYYPKELLANRVERAELINYSPSYTKEFISKMDPDVHHIAYFFGHSIDESDITEIKRKGYETELYPTEWFVYLIARPNVPAPLREAIISAIDSFRESGLNSSTLGVPAYSIAPADREFALNKQEYLNTRGAAESSKFSTNFKIATLTSWAAMPFNKKVLQYLEAAFPNIEIELVPPKDALRLFSGDFDISLALLGISHSDPISHLSFLESTLAGFNSLVSKEEIAELSMATDAEKFNKAVKEIEIKINRSGLIVPIAHFPGVVAHRKDFRRDDNLSYGWGIQTWSFHVD
jgi:hypothetical protein